MRPLEITLVQLIHLWRCDVERARMSRNKLTLKNVRVRPVVVPLKRPSSQRSGHLMIGR